MGCRLSLLETQSYRILEHKTDYMVLLQISLLRSYKNLALKQDGGYLCLSIAQSAAEMKMGYGLLATSLGESFFEGRWLFKDAGRRRVKPMTSNILRYISKHIFSH